VTTSISTLARETKTLSFKIKAIGVTTSDDGQQFGQIEAYGAAFNNIDEGNDRILPGAFTRTIQNSKARAKARGKKYILKMLWQHDANEIIGGWYSLAEDTTGLLAKGDIALATQRGREFYELAKAEMIDEFSIIYDIPSGGAKYDKSGVRDLSELRLFSIDPVTFPMNDEPHTVGVKSMEVKFVCGNTTGPIGSRDEAWDGAKAKGQIWAAAGKEDGSLNAALAKKYFMVCDGDDQKKGSYSYPFWYVGSEPHICVGAVKAIAGAIQGSRGADAPSGLKGKVETLYKRINAKYPDDPELTPSSFQGGKGRRMDVQKKTLLEHYNQEMAEDLLEDWQDVYVCSLTSAVLDAFTIGDQPASDISEALDAFKELVLSKFVVQAQEVGLSEYLAGNTYSSSPAEYTMQYGSESKPDYGYMSRRRSLARKAGRVISAANQDTIDDHVSNLHDIADQATKAMKSAMVQMKAVHTAADDFANTIQGAEKPYVGDDSGKPDEGQQEGKQYALALAELKALRK